MTAVLLGQFTLGDAVPGLKDALDAAGQGLQALKGVVDGALGTLGTIANNINSLASAIDAVKNDFLSDQVSALQDLIDSTQGLLGELQALPAPQLALRLPNLIDDLTASLALLDALDPTQWANDQISGLQSAIDAQQDKLDAALAQVQDLTNIADDVAGLTSALTDLQDTLQNAADDAINGIVAYTEQLSEMLNDGVYVVSYTGTLGNLGSDVNSALSLATGLNSGDLVSGPMLIVKSSNTAALAAINGAFGL